MFTIHLEIGHQHGHAGSSIDKSSWKLASEICHEIPKLKRETRMHRLIMVVTTTPMFRNDMLTIENLDVLAQAELDHAALQLTPFDRERRDDYLVEILRTLHSFDPCLACSTHVMSPEGQELTTVKVR